MNLIFLCLDSFRQDHVSFYHGGRPVFDGVPACRTPHLDAFARRSVVFENMYPCGLPTLPTRMELMTGQFTLPYRPWQPLAASDVTMAELLRKEDYVCGLISDTWHFRAPGMNYHRGFNAYEWIRGQEYDPLRSTPPRRPLRDYVHQRYPEIWRQRVAQFLANTDSFRKESQWFPAQVVERACDWLKRNRRHKRIFCWIDSFDPHEPWDPPKRFDRYTDRCYRGPRLILPMGGLAADWATPEQIRHIRGLYAGEAAFVDHCLGELFACLERLGYFEDSIMVVSADHGHPLADHGKFLKGADRMYSELLKVPFFVRGPKLPPRRVRALAQFPDVLPTLLELLGLGNNNDSFPGRSFARLLRGQTAQHRDAVICGYHAGVDRCIRDQNWSYIQRPAGEADELYHLRSDPRETRNLIDDCREQALRLSARFGNHWRRQPGRGVKGVQGQYEMAGSALE